MRSMNGNGKRAVRTSMHKGKKRKGYLVWMIMKSIEKNVNENMGVIMRMYKRQEKRYGDWNEGTEENMRMNRNRHM